MDYAFAPKTKRHPQRGNVKPRAQRSSWVDLLVDLGGYALIGSGIGYLTVSAIEAIENFFATEEDRINNEAIELLNKKSELTEQIAVLTEQLGLIDAQVEELESKRQALIQAQADVVRESVVDENSY